MSYDERTAILKSILDKDERTFTIEDLEDENSFPISYWHQKFGLNLTINYDIAGQRFKLDVDKVVFELLPYWVPN